MAWLDASGFSFPEASAFQHGKVEVLHGIAFGSVGSVDRAVIRALGGLELAHSLPELVAVGSVAVEVGCLLGGESVGDSLGVEEVQCSV